MDQEQIKQSQDKATFYLPSYSFANSFVIFNQLWLFPKTRLTYLDQHKYLSIVVHYHIFC